MSSRLTAALAVSALSNAVALRDPAGTTVHSDRAAQSDPTELLDAGSGTVLGAVHPPKLERDQVSVPWLVTDGTVYGGRGCPHRR